MVDDLPDEPVAIDSCDCRRSEGKDPVVNCPEQQAVKLRFVAGEHKIQDLPAAIAQNLVATRMSGDHDEDPGRYLSFPYDVRMCGKFVQPQDKTIQPFLVSVR